MERWAGGGSRDVSQGMVRDWIIMKESHDREGYGVGRWGGMVRDPMILE